MNNTIENKWLRLVLSIIISIIAAAIIFPLFDWIYASVITHNQFIYSVREHILEPIIFGIIFGVISWFFQNRANIKKDEEQ